MRYRALIWGVAAVAAIGIVVWLGGDDLWLRLIGWIMDLQRQFHRALAAALRGVQDQGAAAAWGLTTASLLYGVFHAAGPGHGKAVIAAYLLSQESHLWRGLRLAVAASFLQGAVALVLIYGLVYGADWLPHDARATVKWSEQASFVLLAAVGLVLAVRNVRAVVVSGRRPVIAPIGTGLCSEPACSHVLVPNQRQTAQATHWRGVAAVVLSIGLRPCTGAVLVLALAISLSLPWAGVASVAAMSAGTAATVSALAVLTVSARKWAFALLGHRAPGLERGARVVAALGGALIAALALSLLLDSFGPAHPLL